MAVDDLWYLKEKGPNDERLPSKRYGRGKRWRVRWTDDAGKPRERLFDKKGDADKFDANVRADVSRGVYVDPTAGKITVAEFGRIWRESRLHSDSTSERVESMFTLHIDPVLGKRQMAQVKPSMVQAWVRDRSNHLAPTTMSLAYQYLTAMFSAAVLDRVIGLSPCKGIQLPEISKASMFIPTTQQVGALGDALAGNGGRQGKYEALPAVAAGTGLRQGELWGLELEHVDFLRREIHVRQQLKMVGGRKPYLAPPKTATSVRTVEIGAMVAESLARHLEAFPVVEVEIDDETNPRKPVRRKAKLIFTNFAGDPIQRPTWSHIWKPAVARAGLPEELDFHSLRHFFATLLIHGGASVKTVQLALGHSTPTVTLNTYVGHWPEAIEATRNLVDAAFGRASAPLRAVR